MKAQTAKDELIDELRRIHRDLLAIDGKGIPIEASPLMPPGEFLVSRDTSLWRSGLPKISVCPEDVERMTLLLNGGAN